MKFGCGAQILDAKILHSTKILQTIFLAHFCESFINSSFTYLPVHLFKVNTEMSDFVEICSKITVLTLYRVCSIMGILVGIYKSRILVFNTISQNKIK